MVSIAARKRLIEGSKQQIEIYSDFLDLVRFPDETSVRRKAQFLAEKYANIPLDVIVTLNTESQRFATRYRHFFALAPAPGKAA